MTRENREMRLCYEILKQAFHDDGQTYGYNLLEQLQEEWSFLYVKIRDKGWKELSDEEIMVLYDWADELGLFLYTTPYCD